MDYIFVIWYHLLKAWFTTKFSACLQSYFYRVIHHKVEVLGIACNQVKALLLLDNALTDSASVNQVVAVVFRCLIWFLSSIQWTRVLLWHQKGSLVYSSWTKWWSSSRMKKRSMKATWDRKSTIVPSQVHHLQLGRSIKKSHCWHFGVCLEPTGERGGFLRLL